LKRIVFIRKAGQSRESKLLADGYVRRTTIGEPRLSELVAEYQRIGYDVEVIEHRTESDGCGVCFEAGKEAGEVYGDLYVRNRQTNKTDKANEQG
jgi:hypothetical protein